MLPEAELCREGQGAQEAAFFAHCSASIWDSRLVAEVEPVPGSVEVNVHSLAATVLNPSVPPQALPQLVARTTADALMPPPPPQPLP